MVWLGHEANIFGHTESPACEEDMKYIEPLEGRDMIQRLHVDKRLRSIFTSNARTQKGHEHI